MGKKKWPNANPLVTPLVKETREKSKKLIEIKADIEEQRQTALNQGDHDGAQRLWTQIVELKSQINQCAEFCRQAKKPPNEEGATLKEMSKEQKEELMVSGPDESQHQIHSSQSSISILSWKTGLEGKARWDQLSQSKADIILLQGNRFENWEAPPDGYKLFQKDGKIGAILVHQSIATKEINNQCEGMDVLSLLIKHPNVAFLITNVLSPVTQPLQFMKLNCLHARQLIAGDFGVLCVEGNSQRKTKPEQMIQKFTQQYKYEMVPPRLTQETVEQQKHDFLLISPQLSADLLPPSHQIIENMDGAPILFTVTLPAALEQMALGATNNNQTHGNKGKRRLKFKDRWAKKRQNAWFTDDVVPSFPSVPGPVAQMEEGAAFWNGLHTDVVQNASDKPPTPAMHHQELEQDSSVVVTGPLWRETVEMQGTVMFLLRPMATVATTQPEVRVFACELSKWKGVCEPKSLMDVLAIGDPVVVTTGRNAPENEWQVIGFDKK